jgi:hypothetical protein
MEGMVLKTGGTLEYVSRAYDDETEGVICIRSDVTESAASYLMETVRFEGDVHVRDIFSLLESNPVLLQVFRRLHAAAYLNEAREVSAKPYSGEYDPAAIEYLELFHNWEIDSGTGELIGSHRLCLRGVGYELRDDVEQSGGEYRKGSRIRYALAYSPLAELLNLPLRFDPEVRIIDSDSTSENFRRESRKPLGMSPTVAQVIDGVLYEISFGGTPEDKTEFVDKLKLLKPEDETQWTTYESVEDLFKALGIPYSPND